MRSCTSCRRTVCKSTSDSENAYSSPRHFERHESQNQSPTKITGATYLRRKCEIKSKRIFAYDAAQIANAIPVEFRQRQKFRAVIGNVILPFQNLLSNDHAQPTSQLFLHILLHIAEQTENSIAPKFSRAIKSHWVWALPESSVLRLPIMKNFSP